MIIALWALAAIAFAYGVWAIFIAIRDSKKKRARKEEQ